MLSYTRRQYEMNRPGDYLLWWDNDALLWGETLESIPHLSVPEIDNLHCIVYMPPVTLIFFILFLT